MEFCRASQPMKKQQNTDLPAYEVRLSERAKRVRLRVFQDGRVEVVVPARARIPAGYLDTFVREQAEWIGRQQARFQAREQRVQTARYETTGAVAYRGRTIPLRFHPSPDGLMRLQWDGERFHIYSTAKTTPESVRGILESWYRQAARVVFRERVQALNAATNYPFQSIRIGGQKTRWGSCSTRGTLSFNWRLLLAPPDVLDYVVIHELAHLAEMNHSPRFWALVEQACPAYKEHVRWLKEHGATLTL